MNFKGREDAQIWKDRLIGKRLVSPHREVADYESWKTTDLSTWEPRVFYCAPVGGETDQALNYAPQTASPLLRLPAEIRNQILDIVLQPMSQQSDAEAIDGDVTNWVNTSEIIFCCKQLYIEGRRLIVEKNTFEWERLPKRVRLCATGVEKPMYDWKTLNIVADTNTHVIKQVYYG